MDMVSLIGAEVLDESAQFALNEATLTTQRLLNAIASDANFLKVTLARSSNQRSTLSWSNQVGVKTAAVSAIVWCSGNDCTAKG